MKYPLTNRNRPSSPPELPDASSLYAEIKRLSAKLDEGVVTLAKAARDYAEAEHHYRQSRAVARMRTEAKTVADKDAEVDRVCSDAMLRCRLAEGLRLAALEAIRSRRQQLSAWQSMARAVRAELELAGTGPHEGP